MHARGRDGEVFLLCRGRVSTTRTREFRNAFMWDTAFTQDNCSRPISDKVEAHDVYKKEHQARQGSQQREAKRDKCPSLFVMEMRLLPIYSEVKSFVHSITTCLTLREWTKAGPPDMSNQ